MKKSFWFWLYFVFAIILAVYFSVRIIMTSLGNGQSARVKSISIYSDTNKKNLSSLAAVAGIAPGANVYSLNLDEINARISNVPDIKTSAVRRLPNGNLAIKVELHQAVAVWSDGENFFPLSSDGTVVQRQLTTRPNNTVVFRGTLPPDISEISKTARIIAKDIDYMEWIENRRWNIHTNNNITVMLPEDNPCAAINTLVMMNKKNHVLSKKIKILDMRDTNRIIVK